MKELTIILERQSTLGGGGGVDVKRFGYTDSETSGDELSDDSSHAAEHRLQPVVSVTPPSRQVSQRSIVCSENDNGTRVCLDTLSNDLMLFTSKRLRYLIASPEAECFRRAICRREWPWIDGDKRIVDDLHIPTKWIDDQAAAEPNALFLLSLAASKMSCRISLAMWRHRMKTFSSHLHVRSLELPDGRHAVQYQGPIGEGNRSIQADRPLPRPQRLTRQQIRKSTQVKTELRPCSALHNLFHLVRHRVPSPKRPSWRPYVAPFAALDDAIHLTPRLISYFEVIIESASDDFNDTTFRYRTEGDCIVIGLATKQFHLNRMAGWDDQSYGYHSDDGGIFHSSGQMLRQYGPTFGAGDTVGCGVDYQRRAIFFTLNGKFLGYAFKKLSLRVLDQDLYPVVGLDTHCPVVCNFGCQEGFMFDLKSMVCNQRSILFQSMLMDQCNALIK